MNRTARRSASKPDPTKRRSRGTAFVRSVVVLGLLLASSCTASTPTGNRGGDASTSSLPDEQPASSTSSLPDEQPAASAFSLPDEAVVLDGLRAGHPRLMVTPAEVVALRRRITTDPTTGSLYAQVEARARALLDEPVLTYDKPDGLRLLRTSRAALQRLYDLGLVWLVDQDPAIAARGAAELEAVSAFPDWNPIHFLDTAEMSHAVAIGYDWLYDALTPSQRTTVTAALVAKGLTPAREAYAGTAPPQVSSWVSFEHNWAIVTNGGVALGALAIADEEPELARSVVHEALTRMPAAMEPYAPDGGWPEGAGYWRYATSYAGYLIAGLDTAVGTDFGLASMPGFATSGDFPAHLLGPTGQWFNWADDAEPAYPQSLPFLFWTAERFDRPQDRAYQLAHTEAAALDVVWYRQSSAEVPAQPLDRLFSGVDVATMRQSWGDRNAWWVGAKGGQPSISHNQLDAGSFVLDAVGQRWAIDLGAEAYNVPGYWDQGPGGQRWTYFRSRAESHNTLVLDPDACEDQDPTASSVVTRFRSATDGAFAITDLTGAYRGIPVRRGIGLLDDRSHVIVQDELSPTKPTELWWNMHTRAQIRLTNADRTALLTQGGETLRASVVGLPDARFSVTPAAPSSTTPDAPNSDNAGVQRLTIHTTVSSSTAFAVVFDDGTATVPSTVTPLQRWNLDGTELAREDREAVAVTPAPNPCKD